MVKVARPLLPVLIIVLTACSPKVELAVPVAAALAATPQGCGLTTPAFCDTFDAPAGTGNRSGDLNGTVWGVSRITSEVNTGQGQLYQWHPTTKQACDGTNVLPDADVRICNGRLVEAVNDGHNDNQTILAMYPKQPFDIAGRTGIATFDVGDDTQGPHAAWPEFWYTDQPVPAPHGMTLPGIQTTPRNGIGVSLALICDSASNQTCPAPAATCPNANDVTVDKVTVVTNYNSVDVPFTLDGCVRQSTTTGQLNHFDFRLSANLVQIYGTDAGATAPLVQLAHASVAMPLSRGLIWIEDVHYNACKFNSQCDHAFTWDNVGFDGPVLPRDLTFDVPESKIAHADGTLQLGWFAPNSTSNPLTLTIPNVTNVAQATGALLTFTVGVQAPDLTVSYSLNGNAWQTQPWVFGSIGYGERTYGVPVPLQQIVAGNNILRLTTSQGSAVANIDLVLISAGGSGSATPVPTSTSTAVSTATSGPAQSCSVLASLNGTPTTYTRPLSFCTNQ